MKITSRYNLGDLVYLVTDPEKDRVMIIAITITPNGVIYTVSKGSEQFPCYEIEMSETKSVI